MNEKYYVYFYYNENNDLLYIGQAKNVYNRWIGHKNDKNDYWTSEVFTIGVREYEDYAIMDVFESYYIKKYPTKYNKARLNYGYTECDINDTSILKKYSIDEFISEYAPKQEMDCNLTYEEELKDKGVTVVETDKIDLFDENILSNINLDKVWFKYGDCIFFTEYADRSYKRKKGEPEDIWLSNDALLSFKDTIQNMKTNGLDISTHYCFDSMLSLEEFNEKINNFKDLKFKIGLSPHKNKAGRLCFKKKDNFAVEKRGENIYEEENNNHFYLISSSEFNPHVVSKYAPKYYTVKDFVEINPDNFIVDLAKFKYLYFPNKEKAEIDSYEKIHSEDFYNHIEKIQNEKSRKQKLKDEECEKERQNTKNINNYYFQCVKFLKKYENEEKKFFKKVTGFEYTSNPETVYSLEEIETIKNKMDGSCSPKQYDYIKGLALQWGLKIKTDVFIFKNDAKVLIPILKNNSVDNYYNDITNSFFEKIEN